MKIVAIAYFVLAFLWIYLEVGNKYISYLITSHLLLASSMIALGCVVKMRLTRYFSGGGRKELLIACVSFSLLWMLVANSEGLKFRSYEYMPIFLFSSLLGLVMTISFSSWLNGMDCFITKLLIYVGQHTLYIYLLHFICFKLVNGILICYYNLGYENMGLMILRGYGWAWVLYSIIGVGLPLLLFRIWELYFHKWDIDKKVYPLIEKILDHDRK